MADLISLTNLTVDPLQYVVREDINKSIPEAVKKANMEIKVVANKSGKLFLRTPYLTIDSEEQRFFFRSISFMQRTSQIYSSLISKLEGFSFFDENGDKSKFLVFSEYPKNGFFLDFFSKVQAGIITDFDNTARSKYVYGLAFIGHFLHSKGINHRYFSPPAFGVSENYGPVLLFMRTSKDQKDDVTQTMLDVDESWIAPQDEGRDSKYIDRDDVFTFGIFVFYLYYGRNPFEKTRGQTSFQKKENALAQIPEDMPKELKELLEACWCRESSFRTSFKDILLTFQSHFNLFPDTDFKEFDRYVKELLALPIASPLSSVVSPKLAESVKNIYDSVINSKDYAMKYHTDFLNSLYAIREQTETYEPFTIAIKRAGAKQGCLIQVPKFMFVSALNTIITEVLDVPSMYQQILIVDQHQIITERYLTLEQLHITTGSKLRIYNRFGNETLGSPVLNLDIYIDSDKGTELKKRSIAYISNDSLLSLFNDISFLTRIPMDTLTITVKGESYTDKNYQVKEPLETLGICENDNLVVKTSFKNEKVELIVNTFVDDEKDVPIYGVRIDQKTLTVHSLTKFTDIMAKMKLNINACVAVHEGRMLDSYKSLNDYGLIHEASISIHKKATE